MSAYSVPLRMKGLLLYSIGHRCIVQCVWRSRLEPSSRCIINTYLSTISAADSRCWSRHALAVWSNFKQCVGGKWNGLQLQARYRNKWARFPIKVRYDSQSHISLLKYRVMAVSTIASGFKHWAMHWRWETVLFFSVVLKGVNGREKQWKLTAK